MSAEEQLAEARRSAAYHRDKLSETHIIIEALENWINQEDR